MSDTPPEFDLKFLPDWLKEGPAVKNYTQYEGRPEESDRPRRDSYGRDDRGGGERRGPRPGGPGGGRPGGSQDRGPRGPRSGPGGPRSGGPGGGRRDDRGPQGSRDRAPRSSTPPPPVMATADVRIDFVPESHGAENIARQIKQSGKAYPLFGTGRLFLEKPERHRVRITSLDADVPLHQIGDDAISFDRAALERNAFRAMRNQYYKEEVTQGEPIKGNFSNVARSQSTGVLLGPTNHHSYQPTLRRIFEERFSRRMSFQEFVQNEIVVLTDEQAINDWKEEARSTTTYSTTQEAEPVLFKTPAEAEQHFRKEYLPKLMKSAVTLECSGQASRALPDRTVSNAVRDAWERERAFPAGLVNYLRPYLLEAGLHFFKHRKRILYISPIKPVRHASGQILSTGVATILNTIELTPKCTRRLLATKILGEQHDAPEKVEQKAALARDLHYLVYAGNVIEFHDGTLDLPLLPGGVPSPQGGSKSGQSSGQKTKAPETEQISARASSEEVVSDFAESTEVQTPVTETISGDFAEQLSGSENLNAPAESLVSEQPPETFPVELEASTADAPEMALEIPVPANLADFEEPPLQSENIVPVLEPVGIDDGSPLDSPQELPMTQSLVDESGNIPMVELASMLTLSGESSEGFSIPAIAPSKEAAESPGSSESHEGNAELPAPKQ